MRLALASLIALTSWGALAARSVADPATEARFFDELARRSYEQREYDAALRHFLLAYDAAPSPPLLYNLALCASLSGKPALAWTWFDAFLASADPDEGRRQEALRRREALGRTLAILRVTTDPPGAQLFVDQREHGGYGTAPRAVAVSPGRIRLIAELEGHQAAEEVLDVAVGARRDVALALVPRVGHVRAQVVPERARLALVRGGEETEIPVGEAVELPVGRYRLVARLEGYRASAVDVTVSEGTLERRRLVLAPEPRATGRLLVATGDVRARLLLDGRPLAETPATLGSVPVGVREVEIRAAGHHPVRRTVEVREGETTYLDITLVER